MSVKKTNGREVVSNLERFHNFVYSEDIDIVFVNKTWLSANINNDEILHSSYRIVRNDRKGRGGGVMLRIKTELFKSVRETKHCHDLEIVLVELTTMSPRIYLLSRIIVHQMRTKFRRKILKTRRKFLQA